MTIGRIGQDFIVNSTATNNQFEPSVAALADGRFVVAWYSHDAGDSSSFCVRARLYNADGSAAGSDFIVDTTTAGAQATPSVAALPDGRFMVAWASGDTGDGSLGCVRGRIFNAEGGPDMAVNGGNDFVIDTTTTDDQFAPAATTLADGRVVVTWSSGDGSGYCIRARVFNGDGSPAGNDFLVNTATADSQINPSVTALADGRFVMTWSSDDSGDGSGLCIRGRIFSAGGGAIGNDFIVNKTATGSQYSPSATPLADGSFVVTWASEDTGDGTGTCIRGRVYNAAGVPAGNDFIVNTTAAGSQFAPSATALADGRFVVAWMSSDGGDGNDTLIRARLYNANGSAAGNDFVVNTTAAGSQSNPSVSALADGRFVVSWDSGDNGDGSGTCIRAQVFDPTVFVGTAGEDIWHGGSLADRISGSASGDTLSGFGSNDLISGDAGNDVLDGGAGDDRLFGGTGDDTLNGNAGADTMAGGTGDDTYAVDNAGDKVIEAAGQGFDRIVTSVTYALAAGSAVDALSIADAAGAASINLTGSAFANTLAGNAGANVLNGGGGADRMLGFAGNDVYVVDNVGDIVSESAGGESTQPSGAVAGQGGDVDKVVSFISLDLSNTARVSGDVENLTLAGTAAINGIGNRLANVIVGNAAANILAGGLGNDVLYGLGGNDRFVGGAGLDTLIGGSGSDMFVFDTAPGAANRDTVVDFTNVAGNNDTFFLENSIFTKLGAGTAHALNPAFFRAGPAAADANDFVVYNKATGALFYDVNGSAAGGAIQIATLTSKPTLTAGDFVVI